MIATPLYMPRAHPASQRISELAPESIERLPQEQETKAKSNESMTSSPRIARPEDVQSGAEEHKSMCIMYVTLCRQDVRQSIQETENERIIRTLHNVHT